ncbi:MAG TPA: fumarylacetoacetase [Bacteroidales bacterium]|nr:MAG: fumarylacetoacetase [Bacteroidetes bacterium GWE2_42_24]OFY27663.1 MAG: fumarylacetoacetase [Bacteroidetes bacterium GWF2_43_11]HAQ64377.1 fumarylacetoacetase [Bacteroidales bacterium]HBZ66510.1 fumarylacetoacetase [Bacteroidales bacterium]
MSVIIEANDCSLKSWIETPDHSDFPIQNIPFGVFRHPEFGAVVATRIGDTVIDLCSLARNHYLKDTGADPEVFHRPVLNDFMALGQPVWRAVRNRLSWLFRHDNPSLRDNILLRREALLDAWDVEMLLPVMIGDYTDFYSSLEHATNVGIMFRDAANPLLPNWRHIPVGYHGRSSSIVVSGTAIHRPKGQTKTDQDEFPVFGPSRQVDFELEMAFVTGKQTSLGDSITIDEAEDHIFGLVLFNDLSARDIQRWEYVPLGPFLAKNFGSVVSPWIVTLDALEPFRTDGPVQEPMPLPYLRFAGRKSYDINLEVALKPDQSEETTISRSNFRYMYWNMAQQLAHQTVNGCNINVGDLYGSGTISGPVPGSYGSLLELAWKGTKPLKMTDGTERTFINDNDTIILRGYAMKDGVRIGFGEAITKILPVK